jgi:hypothetical protein
MKRNIALTIVNVVALIVLGFVAWFTKDSFIFLCGFIFLAILNIILTIAFE